MKNGAERNRGVDSIVMMMLGFSEQIGECVFLVETIHIRIASKTSYAGVVPMMIAQKNARRQWTRPATALIVSSLRALPNSDLYVIGQVYTYVLLEIKK